MTTYEKMMSFLEKGKTEETKKEETVIDKKTYMDIVIEAINDFNKNNSYSENVETEEVAQVFEHLFDVLSIASDFE